VIVIAATAADIPYTKRIASEFRLPWRPLEDSRQPAHYKYQLIIANQTAQLIALEASHGAIQITFTAGHNTHRLRYGGGKKQPLARAIGIGKTKNLHVLDATAGYGSDAFVLASLGCNVTLTERVSVLAAMLSIALAEARADAEIEVIAKRMQLQHMDAKTWLATQHSSSAIDVIYLDPMYPSSTKKALTKKNMQALKVLAGPDQDGGQLLNLALATGVKRVVVKRPSGAATLSDRKPDLNFSSPNTRYDVYLGDP